MTWGLKVDLPPTLTAAEVAEAVEAARARRHMRRLGLLGFAGFLLLGLAKCAAVGDEIRDTAAICSPQSRRGG